MTDHEQQRRGQDARLILDNPVYQEAWAALRERIIEIMASARTDEATLHAKTMLGLLNDLKAHMTHVLNDGKVATATIELEAKKEAERKKWYQRAA